jgi:hypothetical protein
MMRLSVNAEATAPVPAKISATEEMFSQFSVTTDVMNGKSLYLFPR